ncbi:hypothetical protein GO755_37045 [Spirosoma sp. HMF4905]|uniref:dUTPase-like domain-containing protein n=1 Tax=Spirosoma arboris TaxID=2682092 RepID=A0A7K1SPG1_9BACT|nr:hypothetical protein [Spirosoma arboris]MVM35681.1 hypothetical protein [Spirosoma arboris]
MIAVISKAEIVDRIEKQELIKGARKKGSSFDVENTSYDLMAGIAICKRTDEKLFEERIGDHRYDPSNRKQPTVTLKPGQMMFVVTHEEIKMPIDLCGTVYSRNSLALKGILALNAGHIDPGYEGPISIKLINLSSVDYTLVLGEPIYTIVFTRVDSQADNTIMTRRITHEEMISKIITATNISLSNVLYDLALLTDFVKKDEFGKYFVRWLLKSFWRVAALGFSIVTALLALSVSIIKLLEFFKII